MLRQTVETAHVRLGGRAAKAAQHVARSLLQDMAQHPAQQVALTMVSRLVDRKELTDAATELALPYLQQGPPHLAETMNQLLPLLDPAAQRAVLAELEPKPFQRKEDAGAQLRRIALRACEVTDSRQAIELLVRQVQKHSSNPAEKAVLDFGCRLANKLDESLPGRGTRALMVVLESADRSFQEGRQTSREQGLDRAMHIVLAPGPRNDPQQGEVARLTLETLSEVSPQDPRYGWASQLLPAVGQEVTSLLSDQDGVHQLAVLAGLNGAAAGESALVKELHTAISTAADPSRSAQDRIWAVRGFLAPGVDSILPTETRRQLGEPILQGFAPLEADEARQLMDTVRERVQKANSQEAMHPAGWGEMWLLSSQRDKHPELASTWRETLGSLMVKSCGKTWTREGLAQQFYQDEVKRSLQQAPLGLQDTRELLDLMICSPRDNRQEVRELFQNWAQGQNPDFVKAHNIVGEAFETRERLAKLDDPVQGWNDFKQILDQIGPENYTAARGAFETFQAALGRGVERDQAMQEALAGRALKPTGVKDEGGHVSVAGVFLRKRTS